MATRGACRYCGTVLTQSFVDLGMSPLCETYIAPQDLNKPESFYPLHAFVCDSCHLVQLAEFVSPEEIYKDYPYFSSFSESWVLHAKTYCEQIIDRLALDHSSLVVEIASNDGYLLQHFHFNDIPCVGIEPAANVAAVASEKGITTEVAFFGEQLVPAFCQKYGQPNLLIGNNVLAHVPDLNGFIRGLKQLLHPDGVLTMEFPHLLRLMQENQFDTIYHEHFCYFSLLFVEKAFAAHGLTIFDVEQLSTHGGSLRIYASHDEGAAVSENLLAVREAEARFGLSNLDTYSSFGVRVEETKHALLEFLIEAKRAGKRVAGYGAPGKGNTLLNYCGIRTDFLDYTVDISPHKQGRYTPGTRIPIYDPNMLRAMQPDYVLILPWNIADEITEQMAMVREWGGQFVVPIPRVTVL